MLIDCFISLPPALDIHTSMMIHSSHGFWDSTASCSNFKFCKWLIQWKESDSTYPLKTSNLKIKIKMQQETQVCVPQNHTYPNTWLECILLVIPQHQPTEEVSNGLNIILLGHHQVSGFQRECFPEVFGVVSSCHVDSGTYSTNKLSIFWQSTFNYPKEQKTSLAGSFKIAHIYQQIRKYLSSYQV